MLTLMLATALAVPPSPALAIDGLAEEGTTMVLTVTGGVPGRRAGVALAISQATRPQTCPPGFGGECTPLVNPRMLASGVFDAQGTWTVTLRVPASAATVSEAWFQALAWGGGAPGELGAILRKINPRSTVATPTGLGEVRAASFTDLRPTATGQWEGSMLVNRLRNVGPLPAAVVCSMSTPLTAQTTSVRDCPLCDYVLEVQTGPAYEVPSEGDCEAIFGLTTFDPTVPSSFRLETEHWIRSVGRYTYTYTAVYRTNPAPPYTQYYQSASGTVVSDASGVGWQSFSDWCDEAQRAGVVEPTCGVY